MRRGHNARRGADHHRWKGGRIIGSGGYAYLRMPDHPLANSKGYVLEHRYVLEEHLGRPLRSDEDVHHINRVKDDNRIENLQVLSHAEHMKIHGPGKRYDREKLRAAGRKGAAVRWGKQPD